VKKVILIVLFLTSAVSISFGALKYKQYLDKHDDKKNTEEIERKIKEVEVEIESKKEEYNKIKEEKKEEIKEVETWQEKIKTIKSYIF